MSDSGIIREFLIALGVKVDDPGIKKFVGAIDTATKTAMKLGTELTVMAAAAEAAVAKVSSQFEDLYYASQRIGASVENIRGFGFALGQVGGTATGARAALESVAEFMRSNPGGENFIRGIGVQTRDASGQMRDMSDILSDLGKQFRAMPYYAAKVRAGMLGIDPITLQALIRGADDYRERFHRMAQSVGVDQQAAAKAGHDFMNDLRDLLAYLQLIGEKFILIAQGPAKRLIDAFRWLNEATHGWALVLGLVSGALGGLTAFFGPAVIGLAGMAAGIGSVAAAFALLIDDFATWREGGKSLINWGQWSGEIDSAVAGLKDMWGAVKDLGSSLAWLGGLLSNAIPQAWKTAFGEGLRLLVHGFINGAIDSMHLLADAIRIVAALLHGDVAGYKAASAQFDKDGAHNVFDDRNDSNGSASARAKALGQTAPAGGDPLGLRNNNPGNLRSWGNAPTRGGFAVFGSAQEGLSAMAGNLLAYAKRGVDSVESIIKKWAPSSENNTGAYIADVAKQLGVSSGSHLNLRDPGMLAKLMAAITQHENGKNPFGSDMMLSIANARLGVHSGTASAASQVSVAQSTVIHVTGDGAAATGQAVAGEQRRVNGDMVRNLKGALG